ncbi:MAG: hypothetical protein WDA02_05815 [Saccharofermentanales bacterium]
MIDNRLDNALEYMNKHNIKVDNSTFIKYVEFNSKYDSDIDSIVNNINDDKYIYTCDLSSLMNIILDDTIDDKEREKQLIDIIIYSLDIDYIKYKETRVYNSPDEEVIDVYDILYVDGNVDEITSDELLELYQKGVVVTDNGIIGIDEGSIINYIDNF